MSYIEKEKLIKADIASIENRVRHAFNQGYDLGFKDGRSKQPNCSEIPTGSTTKNDLEVDCISRQAVIDLMMQKWGENFSGDDAMQESIDAIRVMPSVTPQEPIHGKCNQCKHYEGVHNVQGHAPCSYHKIGGVMWDWYCSQFESEG